MSTLAIIENIAAHSGKNDKIALLKEQKDNATLKRVCELAYDDTLFFIKKIPEYNCKEQASASLDTALQNIVNILASREKTGNEAIEFLKFCLEQLTSEDAKVLEMVIKKDLNAGFSDSTINKVWKNLIEDVPYMRCNKGDEKGLAKITYPAFAQKKADGMFFNIFIEQGKDTVFKTRNGKEVDMGPEITALFNKMNDFLPFDIVLHGEGLVKEKNGKTMDRKKGNGLLTKLQKAAQPEDVLNKIRKNVFFNVWDYCPTKNFVPKGSYDSPAFERYGFVKELAAAVESDRIVAVETVEVANYDEAVAFYKRMRAQGEEGAILKNKAGIWEDKTSKNQVKMKAEEDCDLLCVGWEPHRKDENLIGALHLESSDGKIKVKAGSGLTKEDREQDPSVYIGKIVTVVYNERITAKNKDTDSLFLPRIVEAPRLDKTEADHSKDIK